MNFKFPKNDSKYFWTQHVGIKMMFYGLSADKIKRVIRNPKRVEDGVASNTIAVMQSSANKKNPTEIWVMYQQKKGKSFGRFDKLTAGRLRTIDSAVNRKIVISAWRYPGVSPIGQQIPIPADILEELKKDGIIS